MNDDIILAVGRQFVEFVAQREQLIAQVRQYDGIKQQLEEKCKQLEEEVQKLKGKIVDGPEPLPGAAQKE